MSTNYYVYPKPSQEDKDSLKSLIDQENWYELNEKLKEFERIHIGKYSHAFKFLFNLNNGKYYSGKKSLKQFLKNNTIYNEYGDVITYEDFWMMVDISMINGIDNKTYYQTRASVNEDILDAKLHNYFERYIDGLRFSTYNEFF